MEVVLELLGTTNNVLARERFSGDVISIGRGFGNDLIVDDAHVDVAHAELRRGEDGQLWIHDLDSVNGVRRSRGHRVSGAERVASGDVFLVGRNKLRIYTRDHALPEAVPIRRVESLLLLLGRPYSLVALLLLYVGLSLAGSYHTTLDAFDWSAFFGENVRSALSLLALAGGVYLLSVLFRRSGNFPSHLSVLLAVAVYSVCSQMALQFARFNGGDHSYEVIEAIDSVNGYLMIFLYLWSVLYLAFNLSLRSRTLASGAAVGVMVLLSVLLEDPLENLRRFRGLPEQPVFLAPVFQVARPMDAGEYLERTQTLFARVDEQRDELLEQRDAR